MQYESPSGRYDNAELILVLFIILFTILTVIYFGVISRYSGSAQWALVLVVVAVSTFFALRLVRGRLRRYDKLETARPESRDLSGGLVELRKTLKRANDGLRYSQLVAKERFVRVLLYKIKVENELSQKEAENLRNREELGKYVHDLELLEFADSCIKEIDDWHGSLKKRPEKDILQDIDRMVKKMEVGT